MQSKKKNSATSFAYTLKDYKVVNDAVFACDGFRHVM